MEPQILVPDNSGIHNASDYVARMKKEKVYKDLSTVIVCPTRGKVHARVIQTWMGLAKPMNQKVVGPLFILGMEVGEAYNQAVRMILEHPDLKDFKYMLALEEDNAPPPDGLLKLYEGIDCFDAIGGLYWTKGELGQPMCYGDPSVMPPQFNPQIPVPDSITECNGLGMGFTLFRMEMLKDKKFEYGKWFQTTPNSTQDLYFFSRARGMGYKFACDARVKVGHFDADANDGSGVMW